MKQLTKEQLEWCEKHLPVGEWKVNSRGLVDVDLDVEVNLTGDLALVPGQDFEKIPVPFGQVFCFYIRNFKKLKSLVGSPQEVLGNFSAPGSTFKTLTGSPRTVKGRYSVAHNDSLESLKGGPDKVDSNFFVHDCLSLVTLEGAPRKLGGKFVCSECPSLDPMHHAIIKDYNDKKLDWDTAHKLIHRPKLAKAHSLGLI
jgi:hypothetical protein